MPGNSEFFQVNPGFSMVIRRYLSNTSCPGAPVAPRHAASRHADRHYSQSRNLKYSTFRDLGGGSRSLSPLYESHRVIQWSMSPVFSRRNHACAIAMQSRSSIRVYYPVRRCLIAEKPCDITRHDNKERVSIRSGNTACANVTVFPIHLI